MDSDVGFRLIGLDTGNTLKKKETELNALP